MLSGNDAENKAVSTSRSDNVHYDKDLLVWTDGHGNCGSVELGKMTINSIGELFKKWFSDIPSAQSPAEQGTACVHNPLGLGAGPQNPLGLCDQCIRQPAPISPSQANHTPANAISREDEEC